MSNDPADPGAGLDPSKAARLVAGLLIAEPSDLEGYRRRCLDKDSKTSTDRLGAAREVLLSLGSVLTSEDEEAWGKLEQARELLQEVAATKPQAKAPVEKVEIPAEKMVASPAKTKTPSTKIEGPSTKIAGSPAKVGAPPARVEAPPAKIQAPRPRASRPAPLPPALPRHDSRPPVEVSAQSAAAPKPTLRNAQQPPRPARPEISPSSVTRPHLLNGTLPAGTALPFDDDEGKPPANGPSRPSLPNHYALPFDGGGEETLDEPPEAAPVSTPESQDLDMKTTKLTRVPTREQPLPFATPAETPKLSTMEMRERRATASFAVGELLSPAAGATREMPSPEEIALELEARAALDIDQFAWLNAYIGMYPEHADAARGRLNIDEDKHQIVDAHWGRRLADDPSLRETYAKLLDGHRQKLSEADQ
ncbi:hypothetical protein JYT22_00630 [Endomicrobium sp. AH-315-J14]|nr:hypothetical protein [Endomicrobium sp. AH-315-J14]